MLRLVVWLFPCVILLGHGSPAAASAAVLRAQAEAFAGQGVMLDPRVSVPVCPQDIAFGWRDSTAKALVAECAATGWRLIVPVAAERAVRLPALVKRGDPVTVRMAGAGFVIRLEAVALGEGRPGGRVMVHNLRSGERVSAHIRPDGQLWLTATD